MGMFDFVTWNAELPDGMRFGDAELQTKSLGNDLETYTITAEAELRDYEGQRVNHTGALNFYTSRGDSWYEYDALFVNGRLHSIIARPPASVYDLYTNAMRPVQNHATD